MAAGPGSTVSSAAPGRNFLPSYRALCVAAALLRLAQGLPAAAAQPASHATQTTAAPRPWSLDLTFHDVGLGIGNSAHIDGLRLNFRDTAPAIVHGINLTLWF